MSTENTRIENPIKDRPNIPEKSMQVNTVRRTEKSIPQMENREEMLNMIVVDYSAF